MNHTNTQPRPRNATFRRIDPEDIFPNNLIERETTFEKIPTISRNPTNKDTIVSPIFAPIPFPSINHFPVIGIYSCKK